MNKEIVLAVAGKLYKKSPEDVAERLQKSDGSDEFDDEKVIPYFEELDKEKVAKIKADAPKWDDTYKKAEKKVRGNVEQELKEAFEIESDLQGKELLDFIKESLSQKSAEGKDKPMTEDEIKASPFVATLVKQHKKEVDDLKKEAEVKLKEQEDKHTREKRGDKVKEAALARLEKIGEIANLPSDKEKASKQIQRLFIDEILKYDYEEKDGKFMPLDKDGKYLQDEHGHAMFFDDLIEKVAKEAFDFKVSKERTSPDHSKDNGKGHTKEEAEKTYTGKEPRDSNEYWKIIEDLNRDQQADFQNKYRSKYAQKAATV